MFTKKKFGQSLIEIILVIALMAILIPVLAVGIMTSRQGKAQQKQRMKATAFLRETQEAVRSVREKGWTTFPSNGTYHAEIDSNDNSWKLVVGSFNNSEGFTQQIVINNVMRDVSGVIVELGGTFNDPSTKKIITTISWNNPINSSINSTMYLTRYMDNASYLESLLTQFNQGNKSGTTVRATSGSLIPDDGEIILGAGGHSDWCSPILDANTLDLPKNGVGKTLSAISGQAFAGTGENASGVSFANISISNAYPPVPTIVGTFDGYKTNGIFGETNYAYITTDSNGKHVVIIDLNDLNPSTYKYSEEGYLDAGVSSNGKSVYVQGNTAYVTVENKLYTFNVTNKSGSHSPMSSITLAGTGNKVIIQGDYAYVSEDSSSREMEIINISNPSNMNIVGWTNTDSEEGVDIYVNSTSTLAYLATETSSSKRELFLIDISGKTGSQPILASYDTNGMNPKGVTAVAGSKVIIVGTGGEEYQVVSLTQDGSNYFLTRCGGLEVNLGINAVSSVIESDNDVYSYILVDSNPEFRIIDGGPGGGYATLGTFESQTFNPGYQTANNRFSANFSKPAGTNIRFQISMANLDGGGNCPTTGNYTFVGPSGTSTDWFTPNNNESVPFPMTNYLNYANPGQCMRYKVELSTTDTSNTPILYDLTINYSP